MLHHRGEKKKHLWVSCEHVSILVVFDQELQLRQEVLRESRILRVTLFLNVDLNQLQYIPTKGLHRLDKRIGLLVHTDQLRNLLGVDVVNLKQIIEDVPQVEQVVPTNALSHPLIYLDDLVDGLDAFDGKNLVLIEIELLELVEELLVWQLKHADNQLALDLVIIHASDHVPNSFVYHQCLSEF